MSAFVRLLARVGALLALVTSSAPAGDRYVALGDSFSSGTGTRAYDLGATCQRSRYAYPALVTRRRPNLKLVFAACAGATTDDVLLDQISRVDDATRLVTITIGGNDAGFAPVLGACSQSPAACARATDRAQRFMREELPGRLGAVYAEIRRRARAAKVVVLGYPRLFTSRSCRTAAVARPALLRLNRAADLLRDTIRAAAREAGDGFVFRDAIGPFERHEICSQRPWINGLTSPITESFHPNAAGHSRGYAPLVLRAIGGAETAPDAREAPGRVIAHPGAPSTAPLPQPSSADPSASPRAGQHKFRGGRSRGSPHPAPMARSTPRSA